MYARRTARRKGFTLVEILIVVIILGILAAIVIPQFTSATTDARNNSASSLQSTLRSQLQLYRTQHNDTMPPGMNGTAGTTAEATAWNEMLIQTDATGAAGTAFGPYVQSTPKNPLNSFTGVWIETADGDATTASGFVVNKTTGRMWLTAANGLTRISN